MSAEQQSTAWSKISLCWKVSNSLQVGAQLCHTHLPTDNVPRLHPEWQGGDSGCQPAPQDVEPQPGGCSCCQKGSVAAGYPINSLCMAGWLFSERLVWIFAPCGSSGLQPVCTVLLMWTGGHSVLGMEEPELKSSREVLEPGLCSDLQHMMDFCSLSW